MNKSDQNDYESSIPATNFNNNTRSVYIQTDITVDELTKVFARLNLIKTENVKLKNN